MTKFSTLRRKASLSIERAASCVGAPVETLRRWERGEKLADAGAVALLRRLGGRPSCGDFSFIDLFAGIGGLRRGFETIGGRCVFTSEWDRFAQKTYRANFADGSKHLFEGDITKVDPNSVPFHDVLLAGFPCQPFSIAGVSKKNALGQSHGFACDTQGTLFFDVAKIIAVKRPAVVVLENVRNLLSHDRGRTFSVIERTLTQELGYRIDHRVIDARCFVPQHRERIFIVGVRDDLDLKADLESLRLPPSEDGPRLGSILHRQDGSERDPQFLDSRGRVQKRYILTDHLWGYLQDYAEKHRARGNGFGFGLTGRNDVARTLSARYYKDGSEILVKRGAGRNPRRLTPRECARLMGFDAPDGAEFNIPVSDTQAYKQFGNSVVVPVVAAVANHLRPVILGAQSRPDISFAVAAE